MDILKDFNAHSNLYYIVVIIVLIAIAVSITKKIIKTVAFLLVLLMVTNQLTSMTPNYKTDMNFIGSIISIEKEYLKTTPNLSDEIKNEEVAVLQTKLNTFKQLDTRFDGLPHTENVALIHDAVENQLHLTVEAISSYLFAKTTKDDTIAKINSVRLIRFPGIK